MFFNVKNYFKEKLLKAWSAVKEYWEFIGLMGLLFKLFKRNFRLGNSYEDFHI
jgi:hypothetical protein